MDRLVCTSASTLQLSSLSPFSRFAQVEAETMSEVDLAKIFRHMLLGVSHTHVANSDLQHLKHIFMGRTVLFPFIFIQTLDVVNSSGCGDCAQRYQASYSDFAKQLDDCIADLLAVVGVSRIPYCTKA